MRYEDAAAFRAALAANLRNQQPGKDLDRLLKRAMMERFLTRTSIARPGQALLKGGYALELRLHQARATQDLDLSIRGPPNHEVVEALRDAGEMDLGDHLSFRIEATTARMPQGAPLGGERLTVVVAVDCFDADPRWQRGFSRYQRHSFRALPLQLF